MSRKVLVPFDGSKAAEDVLQVLDRWLICGQISEAILVRVERPVPDVVVDYVLPIQQVINANAEIVLEAQAYLEKISGLINWHGAAHRSIVLLGEPTTTLARLAEEEGVDVVMVAVEVRRGLNRFLHYSAERALHAFNVPVLMLGEPTPTHAWSVGKAS